MKTIKEIRDVPVGTKAALVSVSKDAGAIMVRWIWPTGTYLRDKPNTDVFSADEITKYFDNLLPNGKPEVAVDNSPVLSKT